MKYSPNAQDPDNPTGRSPDGPPVGASSPLLGRQTFATQTGATESNSNQPNAPLHERQSRPEESRVDSTFSVWAQPQNVGMPPRPRDQTRIQSISKDGEHVSTKPLPDPHSNSWHESDNGAAKHSQYRPARKYWSTIWLRRRMLLLLAMLFAILAVSLIIVWRINKARNGFRTTLSSNHYSWTYGPTAILVVVVSFWRQVDFYCKVVQPWRTMKAGPGDAGRTVLLDYVSPLNAISFIRAMKFRDGHVASSITGFVILKLIILFSTGLLVLTPTSVSSTWSITITEMFDAEKFQDATLDVGVVPAGNPYQRAYTNISASPVYEYLKILQARSPSNELEAEQYVVPSMKSESNSTVSSVLAELDVFSAKISCERADAVLRPSDTLEYLDQKSSGLGYDVTLESATCSVGAKWQSPLGVLLRPGSYQCVGDCETWTSYNLLRVNCSDIVDPERYADKRMSDDLMGTTLDVDPQYDLRFALVVANLTFETDERSNQNATQHQTAATICKVDYSMNAATVLRDFANNSATVQDLTPADQLSGFSGMMLGEAMHSALYASQGLSLDGVDQVATPSATPSFYRLLLQTLTEPQIDQLLSAEVLERSALSVWEGLSAQLIREYFLKPSNETTSATAKIVEERLHIETRSLSIMLIGFASITMLTLSMMMTVTTNVIPQNPGLIHTSALVLRASPDVRKILIESGGMRTSQLTRALRGLEFRTSTEDDCRISAFQSDIPEKETAKFKTKTGAWSPLIARYPMLGLTLTLPMAAIVVLEVLYTISERDSGFVEVSGSETTATYLSRYISALTALLIATCFNMLDFTISSFAPYSRLRMGSARAKQSVSFSVLGNLPPVAFFHSIMNRQFAPAFSNLAGTIGSILTVVASGLFLVNRAVVVEMPVLASFSDRWDVNWPNSAVSGDSGAALVFDQFQHGSATMPSTIWNDLVIPGISNVRSSSDGTPDLGAPQNRNYTFVVDSLRPLLSCQVVAEDNTDINTIHTKVRSGGAGPLRELKSTYVSAYPPLSEGCQHGGRSGTAKHYSFSSFNLTADGPNEETAWVGSFDDLHLGPWTLAMESPFPDSVREYGEHSANIEYLADNPAGCPSIGVTFAKLSTQEGNNSKDDVTALICAQKIEQVKVKLTYRDDENGTLTLHPDIAPAVVDGSTRFLTNGTEGVEDFPYRVQAHLQGNDTGLTTFNTTGLQRYSVKWASLDLFMNHLVFGPNGTKEEALLGKANQATLIEAVQEMYAKYMRIVIDLHFRVPLPAEAKAAAPVDKGPLSGVVYANTSRLQVNYGSKLALQIMLSVMTLLGVCAFLMSDLRGSLPRAPYSIASTMAFVAISDLCDGRNDLLPHDAQWMRREELDEIFNSWRFSLGWWSRSTNGDGNDDEHAGPGGGRTSQESLQVPEEKRFGINIDVPEHLGFRETRSWALRRRLTGGKISSM